LRRDTSDGDTIYVEGGVYFGNIQINKTISLIGAGKENTTIYGDGVKDVVWVTSSRVNVSGFTIINSGSAWDDAGIELYRTNNCIIENNSLQNSDKGIFLYFSSFNLVLKNKCISNYKNGIDLYYSPSNRINDNNCSSNFRDGIGLSFSSDTSIINNTCNHNVENGIFIYNSDENAIYYNSCNFNGESGIKSFYCSEARFNHIDINHTINGNTFSLNKENRQSLNIKQSAQKWEL